MAISIILLGASCVLLAINQVRNGKIIYELSEELQQQRQRLQKQIKKKTNQSHMEGIKVIEVTPHHPIHQVRISFWLDSRDWSKLEESDEWKVFSDHLEKVQTRRIQKIRKEGLD